MREKIRLSDLTIVFICSSHDWKSTERRCLADAVNFRNTGGTSIIYCYEKSFIDVEAEKQSISRFYLPPPKKNNWKHKIDIYFQLQDFFKNNQVDLIHNFSLLALIPLSLALKSHPQIPFIYTYNEHSAIAPKNYFQKWLLARIDFVFTFSRLLKEFVIEKFPIKPRKILITGAGIDFLQNQINIKPSNEYFKVFCFVARSEVNSNKFKFFLDAIEPIFHHLKAKGFNQKIQFTLLTDLPWADHNIYESIKRMILERHLEMAFKFETRYLDRGFFRDCDLFVELEDSELFSELSIYAFMCSTPCLLPRTPIRQEIISYWKGGETYFREDGRELKAKFCQIIFNYSRYLEKLNQSHDQLKERHSFDFYYEEIYKLYETLYSQRLRYSQKQKKLA